MKFPASLALISILVISSLIACQPQRLSKYGSLEGKTMGTSYHITYELPKNIDSKALKLDIDKKLLVFNDSLSTYQKDSTITKFNNALVDQKVKIKPDFIKVFNDSKVIYKQSEGAFDPTVKPILELWGFGTTMLVDRLQSPPTDEEIEKAKQLIDFDSITLEGDKLTKSKEGVEIDFSAIAKGYGVDVIANVLKSDYNIQNYMVEIGGEVATSGVNSRGQGWQIAIDAPILHSGITDRKIISTIRQPLDSNKKGTMHLATSGNYRNSIVFDDVRYSHTTDPATGRPIVGGASSVTVAEDTVALADAWATAFTAMPYKKAIDMAQRLNKAVIFVVLKDGVDPNQDNYKLDDWQIIETNKMKELRSNREN